jgi:hypothetical protein
MISFLLLFFLPLWVKKKKGPRDYVIPLEAFTITF